MSTNSAPSLRLEPAAPRVAMVGLLVIAPMAVYAIACSGVSTPSKLLLWVLAGVVLVRALRELLRPWPLLEWDRTGQWWLHGVGAGTVVPGNSATGPEHATAHRAEPAQADLIGAARLGPLLVLRLRIHGRRRALLLTPDRLPADHLRRLRVRLGLG